MTRTRKMLVSLGAIVVLGIVAFLLFGPVDESKLFTWDAVTRGNIRETINASGEIQAKVKINIGTSVTGEIKEIHVKDGQDVKAGDLLVTIDQERLRQELVRSEAGLDAARQDAARLKAVVARGRESFIRTERLFGQGLVSDEDYRQAKLALESAELNARAADANVNQNLAVVGAMRDGLGKAVLRAPISGRVMGLKAEKGETAIPGMSNLPGATLMVISDMSEIMAEIKVNESEVVRLRPDQMAQVVVESMPGRIFPGVVHAVASSSEKSGQDANLYKVKVALTMSTQDVERLRPGMSARAVVLTSEVESALRIPLQAVLERDATPEDSRHKGLLRPESRTIVMVHERGRVKERTIKTGIASTSFYEVKEGLAEGEKVLTGPVRKLKVMKDGDKVSLKKKSDSELEAEAKNHKEDHS